MLHPALILLLCLILSQIMAKYKLDILLQTDFQLIGIVTPLPAYRVAYFINMELELCLKRKDDWVLEFGRRNEKYRFPLFCDYLEIDKLNIYLLGNKALQTSNTLLPEHRYLDFLLMLKGVEGSYFCRTYSEKLAAFAHFQTIVKIDVDKLSSIENIIIDDEIIQQD